MTWEQHFERCVDWLARLPNVDCVHGDPVLAAGPMQGLPRIVFQDYFLRFRVQRFRFARIRWQQWSSTIWDRWLKVRRPWEEMTDRAVDAQERQLIAELSSEDGNSPPDSPVPDNVPVDSSDEAESTSASEEEWHGHWNWSWDSRESGSSRDTGATGQAWAVSKWHRVGESSSSRKQGGGGEPSWANATAWPRRADRGAPVAAPAVPPGEPMHVPLPGTTVPFTVAQFDVNPKRGPKVDVAFLKRTAIGSLKPTSNEWCLMAGANQRERWNARETGCFKWNEKEDKVLKHAYRVEGPNHVVALQGATAVWGELCNQFPRFKFGDASDTYAWGVAQYVAWQTQRPHLHREVAEIQCVSMAGEHPLLGEMQNLGCLLYVTLHDGQEPDFVPGHGYEVGYHASSMYCLQRAIYGRVLSSGPGQLTNSKTSSRTAAVYYHREQNKHLCLASYNHYVALADGPWFFAPVFVLDVAVDHPALWIGPQERLPTTIRGQGLTYHGMHRVVGFFIHMVHAAEFRFVAQKRHSFIIEGTWSPGLELPATLPWCDLVERSRAQAKDNSFVFR